MKTLAMALMAALALAACGVDGDPEPPAAPGVSIEGEAIVGVTTGA